MRVKRLEIQGFKSFKDKTVIHFDEGITGIVGPNGCGKSNIVDAFFWVMGEQSYKHMRGASGEDLIFNGSSKYAPLGLAEATLVLETDFADEPLQQDKSGAPPQNIPIHLRAKEISVTRRLYRSGEGEYFINGQPARLKDIHELFMDTGVGAKGYSVIEQGQIGKVVNAKPEERRLLIEEAAGIAKYKARKKESLRKVEATQTNLSRLNDVIQEIERNLGSLERQAQRARLYKKYKEELLDKEMTWGRRKVSVLTQKRDQLKKKRETLEADLVGLRAELQTVENSIEIERVDQVTDSKEAEQLQSQIQELSDHLAHERGALDLSRQRQDNLVTHLRTLEQEKTELANSFSQEAERLARKGREAKEAEDAFAEMALRAQAMDERTRKIRQETETIRRNLENTKRTLFQGVSESSDLASQAASLESQFESKRAHIDRLSQQIVVYQEKLAFLRQEEEKCRSILASVQQKQELLKNERKEGEWRLQSQEYELKNLEKNRENALQLHTQIRSKLQSLEELAAAYEGFGDGPKALLEWAKSKEPERRRLFALADAFTISEGFETAIEGWLEMRLESLIAADAAFALSGLSEIQKNEQGRASIYVGSLSPIERRPKKGFPELKSFLESVGIPVLGELTAFVEVNHDIGIECPFAVATIAQLISGVCIVDSFDGIPELLQKHGFQSLGDWALVSKDGKALDANQLLRGGSHQASDAKSVLRRKRIITELQRNLSEAESVYQGVEAEITQTKNTLDLCRAKAHTLQSELQLNEVQVATLERDLRQFEGSIVDTEEQLESVESEKEEVREASEEIAFEKRRIETELNNMIASRSELESRILQGDAEVAAKDAECRAQEAELQLLKVSEASLKERTLSLRREFESSRSWATEKERRLQEIHRALERANQEQQQHFGGDDQTEKKIEELTLKLATVREALALVKDRVEQSGSKLNASLDRIKELRSLGDQKSGESNQLALEIEKISSDLEYLLQNLEEKYGPGCLDRPLASPTQEEMGEPVITSEMTAEEELILGEEVERIRERIRRLGEVNVMAIEEYEDVKKRFDHLVGERQDLERSILNLQDAIEHINKTSEERFKKAFDAIAGRFERLFPIIFGGGQAKLSLTYQEGSNDVLDAGVDILAQPPGKKIVNIGLLSGGEKALTAVSLIFAVFMVKPSPFCVLDEVDAPLDDANIGKFNALLREMSAKSQFILITHNKKTMELNDTLYGVTMEEPGVSKMVSIQIH